MQRRRRLLSLRLMRSAEKVPDDKVPDDKVPDDIVPDDIVPEDKVPFECPRSELKWSAHRAPRYLLGSTEATLARGLGQSLSPQGSGCAWALPVVSVWRHSSFHGAVKFVELLDSESGVYVIYAYYYYILAIYRWGAIVDCRLFRMMYVKYQG